MVTRCRSAAIALAIAVLFAVPSLAAGATTVSQSSPGGLVTTGQATSALRLGTPTPAPPGAFGASAARMTTGSGGWDPAAQGVKGGVQQLYVPATAGKRLADVDRLKYRALRTQTSDANLDVALKIEVLSTGTSGYTTLAFEPIYNVAQQPIQTGAWQTWDAYDDGDAIWWSSRAINGVCASSCYVTLDQIVAANPDAVIVNGVQLTVGENAPSGGWTNFSGWVDGLEIGIGDEPTQTYDFADDGGTTIPVAANGTRLWTEVSNAVNAAADGETVDVAAGTYVDQVVLAEDVTLRGAGAGTVIESPPIVNGVLHNGTTRKIVVGVSPAGSGSTIESLVVDGRGRGDANNQFIGIGAWNAAVTIDDVRVTGIRHTPLNGVQNGLAIWADTQGAVNAVTVTDSTVDDFQKNGITLNGDVDVDVRRNTVTGIGATGLIAQNGLQVSRRATGDVVGNTITGHSYTNHAAATSAGVLLYQPGAVTVSDNTLTGNDSGVSALSATGTVAVTGNSIAGSAYSGVSAWDIASVTLTGNTITGTDGPAVDTGTSTVATALAMHFNRIAGNDSGLAADAATVAAEHNWWGCQEGPADDDCDAIDATNGAAVDATPWLRLATTAAPASVQTGGEQSAVTARWASSDGGQPAGLDAFPAATVGLAGTLGDVAPSSAVLAGDDVVDATFTSGGAAGDGKATVSLDAAAAAQAITVADDGVTLVDDSDTTSDAVTCGSAANPCGTIARGIAVAGAGDEVRVAAGTYPEQVDVAKRVVLKGAQAGVDARDRSVPAAQESVLSSTAGAFSVTADGVVIDGFTVTNATAGVLGTGIFLTSQQDGAVVRNTKVEGNIFGLYLNSADGGDDTVVERNLFKANTAPGAASGNGIYSDQGLDGALVQDNRFEGHTNAAMVLAQAPAGTSDVTFRRNAMAGDAGVAVFETAGVTIEDNTWSDGGTGSAVFLGGGVSDAVVRGNVIGALAASSGVSISDLGSGPNTGVQVVGNRITGRRRAITVADAAHTGKVEAHFNRLVGNAVALRSLDADAGDGIAGENNWFGRNAAPDAPATEPAQGTTGNVVVGATVTAAPRLVLSFTGPNAAPLGANAGLTASLRRNSAGQTPAGNAFPPSEAQFASALGTIGSADDLSGAGDATTTLATGATAGDAAPSVTLDDQTLTRILRVGAGTVHVDDAGTPDDTLGCGTAANPCDTVGRGVETALAGDTVDVAAGVYDEAPEVTKALTVRGAQHGADARTRDDATGDESVLDGLKASASVTVDGLYLQQPAQNGQVLMSITAGSGHAIRNTVLSGGRMGLDLSSPGDGTVVERNRFAGNRSPDNDGNGSHGLWSHPSTRGTDLAIRDNAFGGNVQGDGNASAMNVGAVDGLTVEGNESNGSASLLVLVDATDAVVTGNRARSLTGSGVFLGKDNHDVAVRGNNIAGGPGDASAVRLSSAFGGAAGQPSTGYVIEGNTLAAYGYGVRGSAGAYGTAPEVHFNRIVDVASAGVAGDDAAHAIDAENNWFGCNAGQGGGTGCAPAPAADRDDVDATPHLELTLTADPDSIATGGATADLVASVRTNSAGATPSGNVFPDGTLVAFAADAGTIDDPDVPTDDGEAIGVLRSGAAAATAEAEATLDGQTVTASVRFGDADGDGIADAADCAPSDAAKPLQNATDANCDGVADPAPAPGGTGQSTTTTTTPPVTGQAPSTQAPFTEQLAGALGGSAVAQLPGLQRIGVFAFRPRGGYRLGTSGRLTLLGFGCRAQCAITPTVTLVVTPKRKGATVQRISVRAGRLSIAAGRTAVLRVKVGSSTRKLLRAAKRIRILVAVTATSNGVSASESRRYGLTLRVGRSTRS